MKSSIYINFIDDKKNARQSDPKNFLHLFHSTYFLLKQLSSEAQAANSVECLLPANGYDTFLTFPFEVFGHRLDTAGKDLQFFGLPGFSFIDNKTIVNKIDTRKKVINHAFMKLL